MAAEGSVQNETFTEFATFVRPAGAVTPKSAQLGGATHCPSCGATGSDVGDEMRVLRHAAHRLKRAVAPRPREPIRLHLRNLLTDYSVGPTFMVGHGV